LTRHTGADAGFLCDISTVLRDRKNGTHHTFEGIVHTHACNEL